MDYSALISLLAFLAAVQFISRYEFRVIYGVLVAVGLPYVISLVLRLVMAHGYGQPILQTLFTPSSVAIVLLQFAVAFPIFYKIKTTDDLGPTVGWSIGGLLLIVSVIPFIVSNLPFIPY